MAKINSSLDQKAFEALLATLEKQGVVVVNRNAGRRSITLKWKRFDKRNKNHVDLMTYAMQLETLEQEVDELKRHYRDKSERPRPDLPANAPINRPKKAVMLRFMPELIEKIDAAAAAQGLNRTEWVTQILDEAADNELQSKLEVSQSSPE